MRYFRIVIVLRLVFINAYAQVDEIKIDPRQYVTIKYRKSTSKGKFETIWNWENNEFIPNQKFNYIDVDGEIIIDFFKEGLVANKDFEGTFSLEAEIAGINGTRKIEVNPYSEIGVQRVPIGIKSEPPTQITIKLLNILKELKEVDSVYYYYSKDLHNNVFQLRGFKEDYDHRINEIDSRLENTLASDLREDLIDLRTYLVSIDSSFHEEIPISQSKAQLIKSYKELKRSMDQYFVSLENEDRQTVRKLLNYVTTKMDIVLDYLNSFDNAGDDALKAVLSLLGKDVVNYRSLKNGLISRQGKLNAIDLGSYKNNTETIDSVIIANLDLLSESVYYLVELSRFRGSRLESIIRDIQKKYGDSTLIESSTFSGEVQINVKSNLISSIDKHGDEIASLISIEAAKIIYKKLVYATIDLGKSGSKNGEVLNVYVTWILDSKKDSLSNSPRLPIGKYYLRETGWKTDIADMFALVKRVNESKIDDQSTVSPSNFKGSGGAVLMRTYNREDRGLKLIYKDKEVVDVIKIRKIMNALEPSFGLNVSYLDFSTEKDVEIGTGLQLGLFRNKVFFGYGINLHMLSPKNQRPEYFYIGFSFARLSDLFKDSSRVDALR